MLGILPFVSAFGDVAQFVAWLHHSGAGFGGLLLPGCGSLCSPEGTGGSQRDQPSEYLLSYNAFKYIRV